MTNIPPGNMPSNGLPDPREELVRMGNEVLNALYVEHRASQRIMFLNEFREIPNEYDAAEALREYCLSAGLSPLDVMTMTMDVMEARDHANELMSAYLLLRTTIEAMETPRPTQRDHSYPYEPFTEKDPNDF